MAIVGQVMNGMRRKTLSNVQDNRSYTVTALSYVTPQYMITISKNMATLQSVWDVYLYYITHYYVQLLFRIETKTFWFETILKQGVKLDL